LESVSSLLKSLHLEEYNAIFNKEKIDWEELGYISEKDLEKMGIPLGHRRKIMRARGIPDKQQFIFHVSVYTGNASATPVSIVPSSVSIVQGVANVPSVSNVPAVLNHQNTPEMHSVDTAYDYDVFLSHKQLNGADLAHSIKLQLQALRPNLRAFLDVDDLHEVHKLEEFVSKSKNFVLLITDGVLDRPFVQLECKAALQMKKNIILVHDERNCQFPSGVGLPDDVKDILSPLAVPYYRPKAFRDVSIRSILDKIL